MRRYSAFCSIACAARLLRFRPSFRSLHTTAMALAALLSVNAPAVLAQSAAVQAVATYKGADRDQKILEAAKKEGVVSLYTSLENADATKIKAVFEKNTASSWNCGARVPTRFLIAS